MEIILRIQNGEKVYEPKVLEGMSLSSERKGSPAVLKFEVVKSGDLNFTEGNKVNLIVNGVNMFAGFVFTKSRDKGPTISVTAYDQLRYLKNKDTYVYEGLTATKLVKATAQDFGLTFGELDDTKYSLSRVEENKTWFDIIQSALDVTLLNTGKMYVLYDDFGKITLKDIENMKVPILVDDEVAEDYQYSTSIDTNTYNQIKLYYKNKLIKVEKDEGTIKKWGVLQLSETIEEITEDALVKSKTMLERYNEKTRTLSVKNVLGDTRVRAGNSIGIYLNLGDQVANQYMLIERCTHTFNENEHFMDLTLWL